MRADGLAPVGCCRSIDNPVITQHDPVVALGAGSVHDAVHHVSGDVVRRPFEGITEAAPALGSDSQDITGLQFEDIDLAEITLHGRSRIERGVSRGAHVSAESAGRAEYIALHAPRCD